MEFNYNKKRKRGAKDLYSVSMKNKDNLLRSLDEQEIISGDLIDIIIVLLKEITKNNFNDKKIKKLEQILKNNPIAIIELVKELKDKGLFDKLNNKFIYKFKIDNYKNYLSILKYKIINNKIYIYDSLMSEENKKYLEVTKINNVNSKILLNNLKNFGFSNNEIEKLLMYKDILKCLKIECDVNKITVKSNNLETEIDLDKPNFNWFVYSIMFMKRHKSSKLLSKNNFINNSSKTNVKTMNNRTKYSLDSSLKLISVLSGMSQNKNDIMKFIRLHKTITNNYNYNEYSDKYIDWMIISTYFLCCKEEKNEIPDFIYDELKRKLEWGYGHYRDDLSITYDSLCIFLDNKNNEVCSTEKFDFNKCMFNDYVINAKTKQVNYKMLFHAIRNALAHSSYDVIDENYIRIYGCDEKGNMNCNLKVNKDIITMFLFKLKDYQYYVEGAFFPIVTLKKQNFGNENIKTKKELKSYLDIIEISNINIKKDKLQSEEIFTNFRTRVNVLLKELRPLIVQSRDNVKKLVHTFIGDYLDYDFVNYELSENQKQKIYIEIEKNYSDVFFDLSASNQHSVLSQLIKNELEHNLINKNTIFELIRINDKSVGEVMEFFDKDSTEFVRFSEIIKVIIITLLNDLLLFSYNGNTNIDYSQFDFSKMDIDFNKKINDIRKRIKDLREENHNYLKKLNILNKQKQIKLKNDNSFPDKSLEDIEYEISVEINRLNENNLLDKVEKNKMEISDFIIQIENMESFSIGGNNNVNKYILKHLRNSLAHGNVSFVQGVDINNISDIVLLFKDEDNKEDTFCGEIKLMDLLEQLIKDRYINSLVTNRKR